MEVNLYNIIKQLHCVFLEILMVKNLFLAVGLGFMEAIHVELSDKRCEIAMFKMLRKDFGR